VVLHVDRLVQVWAIDHHIGECSIHILSVMYAATLIARAHRQQQPAPSHCVAFLALLFVCCIIHCSVSSRLEAGMWAVATAPHTNAHQLERFSGLQNLIEALSHAAEAAWQTSSMPRLQ
jgi:hypothetical protein